MSCDPENGDIQVVHDAADGRTFVRFDLELDIAPDDYVTLTALMLQGKFTEAKALLDEKRPDARDYTALFFGKRLCKPIVIAKAA